MTESSDKNRFTEAGLNCVYNKDNIHLYEIETYYQFVKCGSTTGYCCMRNPSEWLKEYRRPLYAIVKILPGGIKIIGGADVGYGTFRYTNNKMIQLNEARKYIDVIDEIYTDSALMSIEPKNKWQTDLPIPGEEVLPDMWFLRGVSDRVNQAMLKNNKVVQAVYQHTIANKVQETK